MATEKMEMLNLVGQMDKVDAITREIVLSSSVHVVHAFTEIANNNFSILEAKENVGAVIDFNHIRTYTSQKNLDKTREEIEALSKILDMKNKVNRSHLKGEYDFNEDMKQVTALYTSMKDKNERFSQLADELLELKTLKEYLNYIKDLNISLEDCWIWNISM